MNLLGTRNVGGRMRRIRTALLLAALVGIASPAFAADPKKPAPAKKAPAKKPAAKPAPPPKKTPPPVVSGDKKKALAEKFAGFKFGMSKDEVLAVLQKHINERFEEKIKATTDVAMQDRYRKEKKA